MAAAPPLPSPASRTARASTSRRPAPPCERARSGRAGSRASREELLRLDSFELVRVGGRDERDAAVEGAGEAAVEVAVEGQQLLHRRELELGARRPARACNRRSRRAARPDAARPAPRRRAASRRRTRTPSRRAAAARHGRCRARSGRGRARSARAAPAAGRYGTAESYPRAGQTSCLRFVDGVGEPWQVGEGRIPAVVDDEVPVTTETPGGSPPGSDPRDDWLAESDADDLEWFEPPGAAPRPPAPSGARRSGSARSAGGAGPVPAGPSELFRRRGIALALLALVVVAVVVAIVAFGGGSGSNDGDDRPGTTTRPRRRPRPPRAPRRRQQTTTRQSTTTTSPRPAGGAVTLPAAGQLKPGDTGSEVATLQKALVRLGVAALTADGNYGPAHREGCRVLPAGARPHGRRRRRPEDRRRDQRRARGA